MAPRSEWFAGPGMVRILIVCGPLVSSGNGALDQDADDRSGLPGRQVEVTSRTVEELVTDDGDQDVEEINGDRDAVEGEQGIVGRVQYAQPGGRPRRGRGDDYLAALLPAGGVSAWGRGIRNREERRSHDYKFAARLMSVHLND
ncbi:hypothetical protein [Streptomyces sp. NPDC001100]